jgi:RNA-binding protein
MPLTEQQKKTLRGLGHTLKPVILVGAGGLSPSLLEEFERSLDHHELMKVKVSAGDRAELVQRVGNVGLLFRRRRNKSKFTAL